MKINITFLGTSQAVPTITRNHTSILLNYKDENILVDCGEGTQRQFRKAKLNPCKLTRILITHWHGDHVLGLPGLFETLALNNYQKTLYIYGPKGTEKFIDEVFRIFIPSGKIKIIAKDVTGKFFENSDFELHAESLDHNIPTNGYAFIEKEKVRINRDKLKKFKVPNTPEIKKILEGKSIVVKGKTIKAKDLIYKEEGKKISFIFDTKICPGVAKLAKDSDLSIMESTYSKEDELKAKEYHHMTCVNASETAKKQNVKKLYLTHLSQRYEFKESEILKEAKKIFKNTHLAEDLMNVEV